MRKSQPISLPAVYGLSTICALIVIVIAASLGGLKSVFPIIILAILEITFSFDNAVLNSQVLGKLNKLWRQLFLTVGITIAVFGVRLLLPIVLVATTTNNTLSAVLDLALHHPEQYAKSLELGYPTIAAFGGVFLVMIGLRFFGENRKVKWLNRLEAPVGEFNQPWWLVGGGAVTAIAIVALILAPGQSGPMLGAIVGALSFVVIKSFDVLLAHHQVNSGSGQINRGWQALSLFLYLELLDASFSFDGVVAAFAITKDILLITAGLGIGALFVRSMTIHLLQQGSINKFRYLIHGAHYAVLLLGVLLLLGIKYHLPEVVTGLAGIFIIVTAVLSSRQSEPGPMKG